MAFPKIMTGARAKLSINGAAVAFATNVGYRIAIPHAPINVLGRYSAARHEPLGYDVTVTCGVMRFVDEVGGNSPDVESLIQPTVQTIMDKEDMKIEILDRKNGKTILVVNRARLTDRGGNMGARDLLTENWTFVGIIADSEGATGQSDGTDSNEAAAKD